MNFRLSHFRFQICAKRKFKKSGGIEGRLGVKAGISVRRGTWKKMLVVTTEELGSRNASQRTQVAGTEIVGRPGMPVNLPQGFIYFIDIVRPLPPFH